MTVLEQDETTTAGAPGVRRHAHLHAPHLHAPHLPHWLTRVPAFLAVGLTATAFYGVLYLVLRELMTPQWANIVALVVSTLTSTGGNRRFTFHSTSHATLVPHHALGLGLVVAGLGLTSGALGLLAWADPTASRLTEVLVLGVANGLVGTLRFVAFTLVMHEDAPEPEASPAGR